MKNKTIWMIAIVAALSAIHTEWRHRDVARLEAALAKHQERMNLESEKSSLVTEFGGVLHRDLADEGRARLAMFKKFSEALSNEAKSRIEMDQKILDLIATRR